MAQYSNLAAKAEFNFQNEMVPLFLNALKLKLPQFEQAPAISSITLAKATKSVPQPHATRQLAELMEHFPFDGEETAEAGKNKMQLTLEGTCAGLDTTVKFSPRAANFGIRKPAAEPSDVTERMVDHALQYASSWRALAAKVKDPRAFAEIQDTFLEMLSTVQLLYDAKTLHVPQHDQAVIINRFEKACNMLGINEPEAAFINVLTIFHRVRDHMYHVGVGVTPSSPYYKMSDIASQSYTNPDEVLAYLKKNITSPWRSGSGEVYKGDEAAIDKIIEQWEGIGKEDEIYGLFRKLELVGADQEAVRNRLV